MLKKSQQNELVPNGNGNGNGNAFDPYFVGEFGIVRTIPHICHFFSREAIFGSIFLHTKVRKSRQNRFFDKSA